jgi:hypothetical protein
VAIWLRSAQKNVSIRVYLLRVYLFGPCLSFRVYPCLSFRFSCLSVSIFSCLFVSIRVYPSCPCLSFSFKETHTKHHNATQQMPNSMQQKTCLSVSIFFESCLSLFLSCLTSCLSVSIRVYLSACLSFWQFVSMFCCSCLSVSIFVSIRVYL